VQLADLREPRLSQLQAKNNNKIPCRGGRQQRKQQPWKNTDDCPQFHPSQQNPNHKATTAVRNAELDASPHSSAEKATHVCIRIQALDLLSSPPLSGGMPSWDTGRIFFVPH